MERAARPDAGDCFATIPRSPMEIAPGAAGDRARRAARLCAGAEPRRLAARRLLYQPRDTPIWPKWALPTLTHHEAVPGHLWQGSLVIENQSIPLLHRNIGVPAYGEGWGLYAEQLADEIGMYEDYQIGRIGMIQSFLYRAARVVMDTGMHAKGWSREQAIRYFIEQCRARPDFGDQRDRALRGLAGPGVQLQDRP